VESYRGEFFKRRLGAGLPDGIFSYQKIPIWVYFGGPLDWKCWYILWSLGIFMEI
jgi:hypothetical protein